MLTKLSRTVHKYARGWIIFVLLLLDSLFMGLILPMVQAMLKSDSGGQGPIDLKFFYTPSMAYEMINSYGPYGRSFYRGIELTVDILYPVIYTLFFSLLISWLFQRGFPERSRMQRLNVVPFGAWLFDLLENLGIVGMLSLFPSIPALLVWLTALITAIKWLLAGASSLLLLIGLVMAVKNRFKRKVAQAA